MISPQSLFSVLIMSRVYCARNRCLELYTAHRNYSCTVHTSPVWEQESGQYEGNNMKSGELQFYIADSQQDSPPTPTGRTPW